MATNTPRQTQDKLMVLECLASGCGVETWGRRWVVVPCVMLWVEQGTAIVTLRIFKLLKQQTAGTEDVLGCRSGVY